jgi:hypothetical protein
MLTALTALILAQSFGGSFASGGSRAGSGSTVVRPATVAWYGDSITQGACSSTPPPAALDGLLPAGYTVANEGIAGQTTHEIYTRIASAVVGVGASTVCVGSPCGHYIVQGAVNTLKSAEYAESTAASVAAIALNGSGVCNVAVADSCGTLDSVDLLHTTYPQARIYALGVLPYAGCDFVTCGTLVEPGARAAAYNAALQTACASRPWLTCVIEYTAFEDPEAADHLKPPPDGCEDRIHLKDPLSAQLAQTVYDAGRW